MKKVNINFDTQVIHYEEFSRIDTSKSNGNFISLDDT